MRGFILGMLILFSFKTFAQIDVGTKWTYSLSIDYYVTAPATIEVEKDTTINGQSWKILKGIEGCANSFKNAAIREEGAKVYLIDIVTNEETILYDYTLTAGDSYQVQIFGSGFVYDINIDSTKVLSFDGKDYNVQFIDNIEFGRYIIEGIGSNKYLVPQGNICAPHFFGLRCFTSGNNFVDFDLDHECDEVIVLNSLSEFSRNEHINIYPNPLSHGYLTIENETGEGIDRMEILNLNGQVLKAFFTLDQNSQIYLDDLSGGLYFLNIYLKNEIITKKLFLN